MPAARSTSSRATAARQYKSWPGSASPASVTERGCIGTRWRASSSPSRRSRLRPRRGRDGVRRARRGCLARVAGAKCIVRYLLWVLGILVGEEVAELVVVVTDGRVERRARLGHGERLLDVLQAQAGRLRELLVGRLAAELGLEPPCVAVEGLPAVV